MKPSEFQNIANNTPAQPDISQRLALAYRSVVPDAVVSLTASMSEGVFFEGNFCRKMGVGEILDASNFLHVDFPKHGIVPVFDCGDNDFICFRLSDGRWVKFNIVDELVFRNSFDWKELI